MTEELFRVDSYLMSCEASVVSADEAGIELDRTVFYSMGGGQPGDQGILRLKNGKEIQVADCLKDRDTGRHLHIPLEEVTFPEPGDNVTAILNWDRRHRLMKMHSCLHLLCSLIDGGVTGGQVGEWKSRLDFDLPDTSLDKEQLTIELNELIAEDHQVTCSAITNEELIANPELVRTMSVQPPTDAGSIRVIGISDVDLQPCGGTHVKTTAEIGRVRIGKIENKGKHNRRINVHLEE